jgi:peptidoglycan/xylan/chitin deacetylase (PgdA/CDA1 family)
MIILLYHRIAQPPTDPQLLCVSPAHFAEHLEVLRRAARVVALREGLNRRSVSRDNAVALTFDDGYADNLTQAKPLLSRFNVPATVFVTPRADAAGREFWWDELDALLLQQGRLPDEVRISVDGVDRTWRLNGSAHLLPAQFECHRNWNVLLPCPSTRHCMYLQLCNIVRPLAHFQQNVVMADLARRIGAERAVRPTHRALSPDEIVELSKGSLIDVGGHTLTHPVLSARTATEQIAEISGCKSRLESIVNRAVTCFSYPYGTKRDYTDESAAFVRNAGFELACANVAGRVADQSDCCQLPRYLVRDWDGDSFASRLEGWLHD